MVSSTTQWLNDSMARLLNGSMTKQPDGLTGLAAKFRWLNRVANHNKRRIPEHPNARTGCSHKLQVNCSEHTHEKCTHRKCTETVLSYTEKLHTKTYRKRRLLLIRSTVRYRALLHFASGTGQQDGAADDENCGGGSANSPVNSPVQTESR